jgi:hypothetical protein
MAQQLLTFEYSSVHGALAAAYTCGALAAEFGPEAVRVSLMQDDIVSGCTPAMAVEPLMAELPLAAAQLRRHDSRLLGIVGDGDGPAWALITSHVALERRAALLVRTLSAVLQARPHRRPSLDTSVFGPAAAGWLAEYPLQSAEILLTEDFLAAGPRAA